MKVKLQTPEPSCVPGSVLLTLLSLVTLAMLLHSRCPLYLCFGWYHRLEVLTDIFFTCKIHGLQYQYMSMDPLVSVAILLILQTQLTC